MAKEKIISGLTRPEMVEYISSGLAFGGTYSVKSGTYTVYLI
jgi:hypothetical protein